MGTESKARKKYQESDSRGGSSYQHGISYGCEERQRYFSRGRSQYDGYRSGPRNNEENDHDQSCPPDKSSAQGD